MEYSEFAEETSRVLHDKTVDRIEVDAVRSTGTLVIFFADGSALEIWAGFSSLYEGVLDYQFHPLGFKWA